MYIFPFDQVKRGSKIIIYGGGAICRQFLKQITTISYCDCLFIADKNFEKLLPIDNVDVCSPEKIINEFEYDKVIIASTLYDDEIYNKLLNLNVPIEKIVRMRKEAFYDSDIESIRIISDDAIYINEYKYTPKHRLSLRTSKIGNLMKEWYNNNLEEIISLIIKFCSYKQAYEKIPLSLSSNSKPHWKNGWISPLDAISIYGFLALRNPRYYVEVGSGNTTLFAAQSIQDNNLRTKIISIDPYPRADIDKLCYKIYRVPLEDMDLNFFDNLSNEDILLIDNSHRSFPNSDVTVFFTEILPRLTPNILYCLHDIFLPNDYSDIWSAEQKRWYNEQYLLCAYLLGGADGDKIKCPVNFLSEQKDVLEICDTLWKKGELFESEQLEGGFFWLERA